MIVVMWGKCLQGLIGSGRKGVKDAFIPVVQQLDIDEICMHWERNAS